MREESVWPRLSEAPARQILRDIVDLDPRKLREIATIHHPDAAPVEIGGHRVDDSVIEELRDRIRERAGICGFPEPLNKGAVGGFDRPVTRILHSTMNIVPADAASERVWNYVTLVLLPDVAVWRWPMRATNRLLGHPRNAFRRLWWRAEVVGPDLIDAPNGLGEDELVNIMERSTIAASSRLSRALAEKIFNSQTSMARSEVMRDSAKRLLRIQAVLATDILADSVLEDMVGRVVEDSIEALSGHA